ncbi:dihydrolipoamide acetyltransferase family protein [Frankia sp. AgB32]|uniref:dihydrolipoamide acetyltransferase family protein n=1 Tax=Frankia sp. AgB32 TaxID=631119 RepID=UPI00200C6AD3|nr:dihydrolipoamide acetyltransferase family protein [Frankia sp. AgB32]MCK9894349.1 2-oxo acid dehydrogenase subunit E2 [Frankia sp. AgB32]
MTQRQFRLPDLGEGLTDADVVRWLVEVGDAVTVNQPLVEVETAKAVVEIPSPFAGVLVARHAEESTTLGVGEPLLTIRTAEPEPADSAPSAAGAGHPDLRPSDSGPGGVDARSDEGERTPVLVGYGPRSNRPLRRGARRRPVPPAQPTPAVERSIPADQDGVTRLSGTTSPARARLGAAVLAKPPVRKLARDLGVDLAGLVGSGPNGTISRADVEAATRTAARAVPVASPPAWSPAGPALPGAAPTGAPAPASGTAPGAGTPLVGAIPADATFAADTGSWRIPVVGVRRMMAQAMVASVSAAPHVTEFLSADMTATMDGRKRIMELPDFAGVRVTPLLFVARALLVAVRRHPMINSRWVEDGAGGRPEIEVPGRVNLGIAVAGPRGLVVPHIPDADRLDLVGLARALAALTADARADRLDPARLRGATITITNVGALGVDIGAPILNPPEAAILALGSVRPMPWIHEGQVTARTVAQLALSFDHRIVDGQLGAAVLADIGAMLTDPTVALAWS